MPKGVSAGEKVSKIVEFFLARPEIYTLKELEAKLPKATGLSSMLIPDLIKQVVDDNLVRAEKVGSSNMYWAFPNDERHFVACETEKAQMAVDSYAKDNREKREHLSEMSKTREDNEDRKRLVLEYRELKGRVDELEKIKWLAENSSMEEFQKMEAKIADLKSLTNKVTDDIFTVRGFAFNKYSLEKKDFNRNFDINDDMDYYDL